MLCPQNVTEGVGAVVLLRAPEGWPRPLVALSAMVVLGVLDLLGSWAAKEAAERRSPAWAAVGALLFLAVFWVYLSSLEVAGLAVVTLGWIVVVQIGVVLLDRYRYDESLPRGAWVVVVLLVAAQAYLILGPRAAQAGNSAQNGQQVVHPGGRDLGQSRDQQGAARDEADQQDMAHGLVTGLAHVSPPYPRSAPPTEDSVLTEPLPVTER
jgi:hypothetical protein